MRLLRGVQLCLNIVQFAAKCLMLGGIHPVAVNLETAAAVTQPSICISERGVMGGEGEVVCLAHAQDDSRNDEKGKQNKAA